MIVAGSVAADLGAFAEAAAGVHAEIVHRDQDAALHGLQSVAHVGDRARHDYAHGVIEVRTLHFNFNVDRQQRRSWRRWRYLFVGHLFSTLSFLFSEALFSRAELFSN